MEKLKDNRSGGFTLAPEAATDFTGFAAGMAGVAETEVVRAAHIGGLVAAPVAGCIPVRIASEILRAAIVLKIVEVNHHRAAGLQQPSMTIVVADSLSSRQIDPLNDAAWLRSGPCETAGHWS